MVRLENEPVLEKSAEQMSENRTQYRHHMVVTQTV